MICFKSRTKLQCCVCLESVKNPVVCKHCVEGVVCSKCMISMCEAGICDRCPTCRQTDWKKVNTATARIMPISNRKSDIDSIRLRVERAWQVSNTRSKCEKICLVCLRCCTFKTWFSILTILTLQWMVGILMICIVLNNLRDMSIHQFTWIAMLVGLPTMHLPLWYCTAKCNIGVCGPISYIQWILWQYTPNANA